MVTDKQIIYNFFRNSRGIKNTARHFGLSNSYVGKIVSLYIKKHNIRF